MSDNEQAECETNSDENSQTLTDEEDAITWEAALKAIWVTSYWTALPPNWKEVPILPNAYQSHIHMANNAQSWVPSNLMVRDSQCTLKWVHGDLEVLFAIQYSTLQFYHSLERV